MRRSILTIRMVPITNLVCVRLAMLCLQCDTYPIAIFVNIHIVYSSRDDTATGFHEGFEPLKSKTKLNLRLCLQLLGISIVYSDYSLLVVEGLLFPPKSPWLRCVYTMCLLSVYACLCIVSCLPNHNVLKLMNVHC